MNNQIVLAGITTDAVFTTCATIFIFTVGLYFKWRYDNYKDNQKLKEKKEFYLDTIKSIIKPMEQQANLYNKLALQIEDKEKKLWIFEEKNELYANLFPIDNSEELYTIFVSQIKDKKEIKFNQYKNIINTMGFIKAQRIIAQNTYDSFFKNYRELEDVWNNVTGNLVNYIQGVISELLRNKSLKGEDKLFSKIDNIIVKWHNLENHWEISITLEYLINPIFEICQENFSDERAMILLEYTQKANTANMNLNNARKSNAISFKYYADSTLALCKTFEEAYNYYSSN